MAVFKRNTNSKTMLADQMRADNLDLESVPNSDFTFFGVHPIAVAPPRQKNTKATVSCVSGGLDGDVDIYYNRLNLGTVIGAPLPVQSSLPLSIHAMLSKINLSLGITLVPEDIDDIMILAGGLNTVTMADTSVAWNGSLTLDIEEVLRTLDLLGLLETTVTGPLAPDNLGGMVTAFNNRDQDPRFYLANELSEANSLALDHTKIEVVDVTIQDDQVFPFRNTSAVIKGLAPLYEYRNQITIFYTRYDFEQSLTGVMGELPYTAPTSVYTLLPVINVLYGTSLTTDDVEDAVVNALGEYRVSFKEASPLWKGTLVFTMV